MKFDLIIAHRVCPALSKDAAHFTDKAQLVEKTSKNLFHALANIKTKIFLILDGCPEYKHYFDDPPKNIEIEIVETPSIGNHPTYAVQADVLKSAAAESKFLYFSEDDYLYVPDAFPEMMHFLSSSDVDFVTPLDHPDRYTHIIPESILTPVRVTNTRHWRKVGTTCCTFMTKSEVFLKAEKLIRTYGEGADDGNLWYGLTKDLVRNPLTYIKFIFEIIRNGKIVAQSWRVASALKYFKHKIWTTRKYSLWGPMPTLAIHLSKQSLSPAAKSIYTSVGL